MSKNHNHSPQYNPAELHNDEEAAIKKAKELLNGEVPTSPVNNTNDTYNIDDTVTVLRNAKGENPSYLEEGWVIEEKNEDGYTVKKEATIDGKDVVMRKDVSAEQLASWQETLDENTSSENVAEASDRVSKARAEGARIAEKAGDRAGEALSSSKEVLVKSGRAAGRMALEAGLVTVGAASLGVNELTKRGKSKYAATKSRINAFRARRAEARKQKKIDAAHSEALVMHEEFRQNQYNESFDKAADELYDNTEVGDADRFNAIPENLNSDQLRGWNDARTALIDSVHTEALEENEIHNYDKGYSDASEQLRNTEAGDADTFNAIPENLNADQLQGWNDAREDFMGDAHTEALAENEAFDAKAVAKKARDAKNRKRARKIALINRANAAGNSASEKISSGVEWSKGTKVAKIGRALARFGRNAKAYAKGVHAAGMESVRNANTQPNNNESNVE